MKRYVLALGALAAAAPALAAQGRPPASELYAKYIEAMGGREALLRHDFRHAWGRFEVPTQGITGPLEIMAAAPAMMLTRFEIPGMGSVSTGFDGETGWMLNPAMGPMLLDGMGLNQMQQQADFHAAVNPEKFVASRETTGEAEFDGKPCWSVTVTTTWQETYTECYDKATGLLIGLTRKQSTPMGELEAHTTMSDYKTWDGMKMATVIRVSTLGIEQVVRFDSVSHKPFATSVFALPAEIKALKK
jgi:hypothetical protein